MSNTFEHTYQVAWDDLDANQHLRNTAYLDYAAQTRLLYLASQGFTTTEFQKHGIGPIVFEDNISYHRELFLLETFTVQVRTGGLNDSGSKFVLVNRILRDDGTLSAVVRSPGAWLDLKSRKIAAPPPLLKKVMEDLERDEDFQSL